MSLFKRYNCIGMKELRTTQLQGDPTLTFPCLYATFIMSYQRLKQNTKRCKILLYVTPPSLCAHVRVYKLFINIPVEQIDLSHCHQSDQTNSQPAALIIGTLINGWHKNCDWLCKNPACSRVLHRFTIMLVTS